MALRTSHRVRCSRFRRRKTRVELLNGGYWAAYGLRVSDRWRRLVHVLDVATAAWVVLWIVLALLVGREVRNLRELSDTVVTAGVAVEADGWARPHARQRALSRRPRFQGRRPGGSRRPQRAGHRTRQPRLDGEPERPPCALDRANPHAAAARALPPVAHYLDAGRASAFGARFGPGRTIRSSRSSSRGGRWPISPTTACSPSSDIPTGSRSREPLRARRLELRAAGYSPAT
jgi:hypothetical protein